MIVKSFAKINLYLDVLSKREDGYHNLDMVTLPLELHDTITFDVVPLACDNYITFDHAELTALKNNLINKTLNKLHEKYGYKQHFNISVHKEIPMSAGLAGGSANSATTINTVQSICKLKISDEEKIEIGRSLGADVPFCLFNKPMHVEGIGEILTPIKVKRPYYVLLIKPDEGLSTKTVFENCDKKVQKHGNIQNVIKALETGDDELLEQSMFNSLEETSIEMVPEIQSIKDMLKKDGFRHVLMSGSGSSVFALTHDWIFAHKKFREYIRKGYMVYLTKTL